MARRLIIVSNRLPVSIHEEHGVLSTSRSNGGLATALASLFDQNTSLWVGWTGLRRSLSDQELQNLALPDYLAPVNLSEAEIISYYDQFSNGILWPVAHGIPATVRFSEPLWHEVKAVIARFADTIEAVIRPSDIIWIHDYHLILLADELRRRGIKNKIGFFLHTPFPTLSRLHTIPHVKQLLKSMLTADLVGLQTKKDIQRFKQYAATLQLPLAPAVKAFPIGIDCQEFSDAAAKPEVKDKVAAIKKQYKTKTIIFSLSRLDYTKGILTQLRAFELLLKRTPEPKNIVYRLNVAPSRESMLEYQDLKEATWQAVQQINRRFETKDWQPVVYTYENIGVDEMTAWYIAADIHLNTPVADGMNLITKEYIAAKKQPGVLIISKTMGAADQLTEALIVPPKNVAAIADALHQAIEMPAQEKQRRWKALRLAVRSSQVADWAHDFLSTLSK